jgi:prolyl-tRNA synthetase
MRLRTFIMRMHTPLMSIGPGSTKAFLDQRDAYQRIFTRCGIEFSIVEASSGSMGGSESNEFMRKTDAGEDLIASCSNCDYAANLEKATSRLPVVEDGPGSMRRKKFSHAGWCAPLKIWAKTPYLGRGESANPSRWSIRNDRWRSGARCSPCCAAIISCMR